MPRHACRGPSVTGRRPVPQPLLTRMTLAMKQDVGLDPLNVGRLGADTVVAHAQHSAYVIQQSGFGYSLASSKPPLKFRFDHDIENHLLNRIGRTS